MGLKRHLRSLLLRAGFRVERVRRTEPCPYLDVLELLVERHIAATRSPPFVVQIGANDGITMDPLHRLLEKYALPGLMVEPQPQAFHRLVANRGHLAGLRFEQVLVGAEDGHATLHVLRQGLDVPDWLGQAASLDSNQLFCVIDAHLRAAGRPRSATQVRAMMEPVQVEALTMASLLGRHEVIRVDLLVLDTMGFDFALIRAFPFDRFQPAIIQFEHRVMARTDYHACIRLLAERGYSFCQVDMDTIASLNTPVRVSEHAAT